MSEGVPVSRQTEMQLRSLRMRLKVLRADPLAPAATIQAVEQQVADLESK